MGFSPLCCWPDNWVGWITAFLIKISFFYEYEPIDRLVSLVVKTLLLVQEVWGSNPVSIKSDRVSPSARLSCDVSAELAVLAGLWAAEVEFAPRCMLRRNYASRMIFFCWWTNRCDTSLEKWLLKERWPTFQFLSLRCSISALFRIDFLAFFLFIVVSFVLVEYCLVYIICTSFLINIQHVQICSWKKGLAPWENWKLENVCGLQMETFKLTYYIGGRGTSLRKACPILCVINSVSTKVYAF